MKKRTVVAVWFSRHDLTEKQIEEIKEAATPKFASRPLSGIEVEIIHMKELASLDLSDENNVNHCVDGLAEIYRERDVRWMGGVFAAPLAEKLTEPIDRALYTEGGPYSLLLRYHVSTGYEAVNCRRTSEGGVATFEHVRFAASRVFAIPKQ